MRPPDAEENLQAELRHIRLERKAKTQILSDDGQSWAVSYSDMLMVLMSFFVIFFSFEEKQKENLVSKIALQMQDQSGGAGAGKQSSKKKQSPPDEPGQFNAKTAPGDMAEIAKKLGRRSIVALGSPDHDQLTVHLPDQIYGTRVFAVNDKVQREVGKILDTLAPYRGVVRIVFIGHSDDVPLQSAGRYLSNNHDLSSLRASRAMAFAVARGFDPRDLSIEASASNLRNSRSLSIKIIPKDPP